ncbi:MAG: RNA-binding S4 domain-containing protein [Gammaproteobacteria bacterium]
MDYRLDLELHDIGEEKELVVRLDKWLWAARFFKTRALARDAIKHGRVLYNDTVPKPTQEVFIGAHVDVNQGRFRKSVVITGLSTRRRNSEESLSLYEEVQPQNISNASRNVLGAAMPTWQSRAQYQNQYQNQHHNQYQQSQYQHHQQAAHHSEIQKPNIRFLRRSSQFKNLEAPEILESLEP